MSKQLWNWIINGLPYLENSLSIQPEQLTKSAAVIQGEPLHVLPEDLYIPPGALEVVLETFEGPLDLLLYLIKKQNLDILNIPIALITQQYMEYIRLMDVLQWDLAAEYLVMAAMLAQIKSQMLLPRNPVLEEETDPRAELARRLLEYERYKKASETLDALPRQEREFFVIQRKGSVTLEAPIPPASVSLDALVSAFEDVLTRLKNRSHHHIQREVLSVSERIEIIIRRLDTLSSSDTAAFHTFFSFHEGKMGVVVTFIAILELVKQSVIELIQGDAFEPITIRKSSLQKSD